MSLLTRFLLYNLLPSLIVGILAWGVVAVVVKLLGIRQARLRLSLLAIPLLKSTLILLGVHPYFLWPRQALTMWEEQALPFAQVLPFVLGWAALIWLTQRWWVGQVRRQILRHAQPIPVAATRLGPILEQVYAAFHRATPLVCTNGLHCGTTRVPEPKLYVADSLRSPLAVTAGGAPLIIFPTALVAQLNDDELAGAIAHELAHFGMRHPCWCSADTLRKLSLISPIAGLIAISIDREEEKACDEMAVSVLGQPDVYAEMLLKSYRFAQQLPPTGIGSLHMVPQLLGLQPGLTTRIERLVQPQSPLANARQQTAVACLLWGILYILF